MKSVKSTNIISQFQLFSSLKKLKCENVRYLTLFLTTLSFEELFGLSFNSNGCPNGWYILAKNNNNILPSPSLNIALDTIILMRERYQFEYITFYSSIDSK